MYIFEKQLALSFSKVTLLFMTKKIIPTAFVRLQCISTNKFLPIQIK